MGADAHLNNPVGKLHAIVSKLKAEDRGSITKIVLTKQLVLNHSKGSDLHSSIGLFINLIERSEACMKVSGLRENLWKKTFESLKGIFETCFGQLSASWASTSDRITDEMVTVLDHCAEHVAGRSSGPISVGNDVLADLDASLVSLFSEIEAAELDDILKAILLKNIELARRAIFEYRLYGSDTLDERFSVMLVDMFRCLNKIEDEALRTKVWDVMMKYKDAVVMINASYQLLPLTFQGARLLLS